MTVYRIKRAERRDGEIIETFTLPDTFNDYTQANGRIRQLAAEVPGARLIQHHAGLSVAFLQSLSNGGLHYIEYWRA